MISDRYVIAAIDREPGACRRGRSIAPALPGRALDSCDRCIARLHSCHRPTDLPPSRPPPPASTASRPRNPSKGHTAIMSWKFTLYYYRVSYFPNAMRIHQFNCEYKSYIQSTYFKGLKVKLGINYKIFFIAKNC